MYEPAHFRQEDREALIAAMRARALALLVTAGESGLMANAVPFLVVEGDKGALRLEAHLARANPQWREIAAGAEVLVVFEGTDAYVTPAWYETKRETGKVVPTWNYVMVQARGRARAIEDQDWLKAHVGRLRDVHEAGRAEPWAASDAPESYISAMARGIVGIEIEVTDLRGKVKASQNRPEADRVGIIAGLEAEGAPQAAAMAALVRGAAERASR